MDEATLQLQIEPLREGGAATSPNAAGLAAEGRPRSAWSVRAEYGPEVDGEPLTPRGEACRRTREKRRKARTPHQAFSWITRVTPAFFPGRPAKEPQTLENRSKLRPLLRTLCCILPGFAHGWTFFARRLANAARTSRAASSASSASPREGSLGSPG